MINNKKIIRDAEHFLKQTQAYKENRSNDNGENYEIHYILKKAGRDADVIAFAAYEDMEIAFHPYEGDPSSYSNWPSNYDRDLFGMLEKGYEIVNMSMVSHYCVWSDIEESLKSETEHPHGIQMYLAYCKKNGITHEKLRESVSYSGMDIMTLYDGKTKPRLVDIKRRDDFSR